MWKLSKVLLIIGGIINALFFVFHVLFPVLFNWPETLSVLDEMNRGVMYTFNLVTTFVVLWMAFVSIFLRESLLGTKIGKFVLILFSGFWLVRAASEVAFFEISSAESIISVVIYVAISLIYLIPVFVRYRAEDVS